MLLEFRKLGMCIRYIELTGSVRSGSITTTEFRVCYHFDWSPKVSHTAVYQRVYDTALSGASYLLRGHEYDTEEEVLKMLFIKGINARNNEL